MDILLRRHARRSASNLAGAKDTRANYDATSAITHMDADELSAYAEGALPERARLRYAAHLADCDACRRLVTGLVLTSNVEAEESTTSASAFGEPRRSWRGWLAALLSPPVLRYAAPALALVAFVAIALVVIRNRDDASLVAKNEQTRQQQSSNSGAEGTNDKPSAPEAAAPANPASQSAPVAANANSADTKQATAPEDQSKTDAAQPPPPPVTLDGVTTADSTKPANDPRNETPKVQEREAETKQPAQTSSDTYSPEDRAKEKDTLAAQQKRRETEEVAGGGAPAPSAGAAGGRASRSTTANSGALGATTEASGAGKKKNEADKSTTGTTARARRDAAGADEDGGQTRTVAGKRFRQQNGVWVDTTYNSSRSTTRVKRGSEQYRALVADEPVIGSVANAFGGDCIVVVRGRAYYIY